MASFADVIRKHRKEGSSRTGALFGAMGEKTLEAIDPRRMFDQSGVLTSLFPSLKAYQAKGASDKGMDKLATLQASGDAATKVSLEQMIVKLDSIDTFSRTTAKNTLILPSMARDTYLIKQNIIKMTKALGEKPQESAGDWFNRQMAREAAFEGKFGKPGKTEKVTAQPGKKEEEGGIGGFFSALFAPLLSAISPLLKLFDNFKTVLGGLLGLSPQLSLFKTLLGSLFSPLGLLASALTGAYLLIDKWQNKILDDEEKKSGPEGRALVSKGLSEMTLGTMDFAGTGTSFVTGENQFGEKLVEPEDQRLKDLRIKKAVEDAAKLEPDTSRQEAETKKFLRQGNQQILDAISKGESGGDYNAMNQGGNAKTGIIGSGNSKKIIGKNLTDMTVDEVLKRGKLPMGNKDRVFAAGRYQIIPSTLEGLLKKGIVSGSDKFNEETQDKLGEALIKQSGALSSAAQGNLIEAQNKLAKIWASIPSATTGKTLLGGPNKADPKIGSLIQSALSNSGTAVTSATSSLSDTKSIVTSSVPSPQKPVVMQQNPAPGPVPVSSPSTGISAWDFFMMENIILNKF